MKLTAALVACDLNPLYLEFLPSVVKAWEEYVGVRLYCILVADKIPEAYAKYEKNLILFKPVQGISTAFQAQCIRSLYPSLLKGEEGVVISDMDIIPARRAYFCLDYPEYKITHLRGDIMQGEICMCYNVGSPKAWNRLFPIQDAKEIGPVLEAWHKKYGGSSGLHGGKGWNIDQRVLYDRWKEDPSLYSMLDDKKQEFKRLDRSQEAKEYNRDTFLSVAKEEYSDYHMHRPYSSFKELIDRVLSLLLNAKACKEILFALSQTGSKKVELLEQLFSKGDPTSLAPSVQELFFFDLCHQYLIDGYYVSKERSARALAWLLACPLKGVWKQMQEDPLFRSNLRFYPAPAPQILKELKALDMPSKSVSVIIPSFNRYKYLLDAVASVKAQTYPQHLITIIIINDGSEEKYKEVEGCINISLGPHCSRKVLGYGYPGFSRNYGLRLAKSEYVAFLDDDDLWMPDKLEVQVGKMEKEGALFSCSDGLYGRGRYDKDKKYYRYNAEVHRESVLKRLELPSYPSSFSQDLLKKHNFAVTSSVVINSALVKKVGLFIEDKGKAEDYDYWLRCLEHCKGLYLPELLFYYDGGTSVEYTYSF